MSGIDKKEEEALRTKFHSLIYTTQKRQQKLREVSEEGRQSQFKQSYNAWKRLNPGYMEAPLSTTNRDQQVYDADDFRVNNKECFRVRDKHTEYVEYAVRDSALARKGQH